MLLEVGKKYKTACGSVAEILHIVDTTRYFHPVIAHIEEYKEIIQYSMDGSPWGWEAEKYNIVEECLASLKLEIGKKYKSRGGDIFTVVFIFNENLRYHPVLAVDPINGTSISTTMEGISVFGEGDDETDLIEEVLE